MVKISVIMPVFNAEKYLKEAIDSVLNQSFRDIEVLCVDDGSTDNSLEMLYEFKKNDNRVQVYHQENNGGGAARNLVLPKAKGKYIYFMDADDIIELNAFQQFYNLAEEKNVDFIICRAIDYNSDTDEYYKEEYFYMDTLYNHVGDEIFNWRDIGELIFNISVTPWGKFFDRKFVINSGARFAEGLIFHDNIFFWEMLFNSKRIYFYDEVLCYRRVHSKSSVESKDKRFVSTIAINNMIINLFIKYDQFDNYLEKLYNRKIYLINFRYNQVDEKYKQFFLDEMKNDFSKIIGHERYDEFINVISLKNKAIFDNALSCKNYKEYDFMMYKFETNLKIENLTKDKLHLINHRDELIEINETHRKENIKLKQEKTKLKKDNKQLKEKNKKLKKENENLKEELKIIKSTVSWKVTKPLRAVKKELFDNADD